MRSFSSRFVRPALLLFSTALAACNADPEPGTASDVSSPAPDTALPGDTSVEQSDGDSGASADSTPSDVPLDLDAGALTDAADVPGDGDIVDTIGDVADSGPTGDVLPAGDSGATADTAAPFVLSCDAYCAKVAAVCDGDDAQYDSPAQCLAACEALPLGVVPDASKDTIACRFGRALLAEDQPTTAATRCIEAGPSGGGVCGTRCDAFCTLLSGLCGGAYLSQAACPAACSAFPVPAAAGPEPVGDSYACRLEAALDGNCASASAVGGVLCSPPPVLGEACAAPYEIGALPFETLPSDARADTTDAADDLGYVGGPCGGEFGGSGGTGAPDHVWRYVAQAAESVTVTLVGKEGFDPILYVLAGCEDPSASCLDKKDSVGFNAKEVITLALAKDQAIFIVVDSAGPGGTNVGPYTLSVTAP